MRAAMPTGTGGGASQAPAFVCDSELLLRAFELARAAHAGQRRRSGGPYLEHPLGVAERLHEAGYGEPVLATALLHDVVEHAGLTVGEVVEGFGVEIGELVAVLSEDPSIDDWELRKRALRDQATDAGPEAAAIYAADKLSNVRDLRRAYALAGERIDDSYAMPLDLRVQAWWEDAAMLQERLPEFDAVAELRSDLESLERERARASGHRKPA
jgi:hypothetical protein